MSNKHFTPLDKNEWPQNIGELLSHLDENKSRKAFYGINNALLSFAWDGDKLVAIQPEDETVENWVLFCETNPDVEPVFLEETQEKPNFSFGELFKPRVPKPLRYVIVAASVIYMMLFVTPWFKEPLFNLGNVFAPEVAAEEAFKCPEGSNKFPDYFTEDSMLVPGTTYCIDNPDALYQVLNQGKLSKEESLTWYRNPERLLNPEDVPLDSIMLVISHTTAINIMRQADDNGDLETYSKRWDIAIYNALLEWMLNYLKDSDSFLNHYLTIPSDAYPMNREELAIYVVDGQTVGVQTPSNVTIPLSGINSISDEEAASIILNDCKNSDNPDWCEEMAMMEYLSGNQKTLAAAHQAALHFQISDTLAPTPTKPYLNLDFVTAKASCEHLYQSIPWDDLSSQGTAEAKEVWRLSGGKLIASLGYEGLLQVRSEDGSVCVNNISGNGGNRNIDAQSSGFAESEAVFELNTQASRFEIIGEDAIGETLYSQKVKQMVVYPVYWFASPSETQVVSEPVATYEPREEPLTWLDSEGTPITPEPVPTLTKPPHPTCDMVYLSDLYQRGNMYQTLISRGDYLLIASNDKSLDIHGNMQLEWIGIESGNGTQQCYHLVADVTMPVEVVNIDTGEHGNWNLLSSINGATVCLDEIPTNCGEDALVYKASESWLMSAPHIYVTQWSPTD